MRAQIVAEIVLMWTSNGTQSGPCLEGQGPWSYRDERWRTVDKYLPLKVQRVPSMNIKDVHLKKERLLFLVILRL